MMPYIHVSYWTTVDNTTHRSSPYYSSKYYVSLFTALDCTVLGQTGFSDGFPFLLTSQSSLVALNEKLSTPITMERFRPNIVVDGCCNRPFDEDRWESIRFHLQDNPCHLPVEEEEEEEEEEEDGTTGHLDCIDMTVVKPCARCMVPNVDPVKGEMEAGKPTTAALKLIRSGEIIGFNVSKWKKEVCKLTRHCILLMCCVLLYSLLLCW